VGLPASYAAHQIGVGLDRQILDQQLDSRVARIRMSNRQRRIGRLQPGEIFRNDITDSRGHVAEHAEGVIAYGEDQDRHRRLIEIFDTVAAHPQTGRAYPVGYAGGLAQKHLDFGKVAGIGLGHEDEAQPVAAVQPPQPRHNAAGGILPAFGGGMGRDIVSGNAHFTASARPPITAGNIFPTITATPSAVG
jgi:hypothetical protein